MLDDSFQAYRNGIRVQGSPDLPADANYRLRYRTPRGSAYPSMAITMYYENPESETMSES